MIGFSKNAGGTFLSNAGGTYNIPGPSVIYKNGYATWDTSDYTTSGAIPPDPFSTFFDWWNWIITTYWTTPLSPSLYTNALAALTADSYIYATAPNTFYSQGPSYEPPAGNGWYWWNMDIGSGEGQVQVGFAKNTSLVDQPYFIARVRRAQSVQALAGGVNSGVTTTLWILDLISSGTISPGKIIGNGGDIALPTPTLSPWDLTNIGNAMQGSDIYFPIIGQTSSAWVASSPFGSFGTQTFVTSS